MHPARSSHGILCSCERNIKRRRMKTCSVALCTDSEKAPKGKTNIISFACSCINKLEKDIKKMNKSVVWWVETQMDTGVDMKVSTV